jgi:predicted alpha/beta-fold hydrolase
MLEPFNPGRALRSPHVQTILGSRGRGMWVKRRAAALLDQAERIILEARDGVQLEAWISRQPRPAPAVVLIHGWLGHADSSYVLSAAAELFRQGFSVVRLNLRDHGDTAHLNEEMFNSARIEEVVDAVRQVEVLMGGRVGVAGYSLGGNFALRIARETGLPTLAVCPAVDPTATMWSIDGGSPVYRLFFLLKWRRSLQRKESAFPERYEFSAARRLKTVSDLTDLFVREHTDYPDTSSYLDAYTLTGDALAGTEATVLYAADDPVIPADGFERLPGGIRKVATHHGGHCAFIRDPRAPTWADDYLVRFFEDQLSR